MTEQHLANHRNLTGDHRADRIGDERHIDVRPVSACVSERSLDRATRQNLERFAVEFTERCEPRADDRAIGHAAVFASGAILSSDARASTGVHHGLMPRSRAMTPDVM